MERICSNCVYATEEEGETKLVCQRFPPKIVVVEDQAYSYFPTVEDGDWCGECATEED